MERCQHSIYLATPTELKTRKSLNCSLCTPEVDSSFLRARAEVRTEASTFVMPRHMHNGDEIFANQHDRTRCPTCNSQIHTVEQNSWRCAECDNSWKGRPA
jgi:hypothetical protein